MFSKLGIVFKDANDHPRLIEKKYEETWAFGNGKTTK
jgi:hypothetical protein